MSRNSPPERRIRITVAYDGTDFHGWQIQPGLVTIQGVLESILSEIEGRPVRVHGSGRTDAGVHAEAQVAALTITNPIPPGNLQRALNRLLPVAIRVLQAQETQLDFHPRFDAVAKTYEYRIFRGEVCPPSLWRYVHHFPYPLLLEQMLTAAPVFEGEHDFSAYSATDPEARSKVRRVFSSQIALRGDILTYRVRGSGFLKHMVRRITGALVEVGKGNAGPREIQASLDRGGPHLSPHSVPAKGLHLLSVEYPRVDILPIREDTL